MIVRAFYLVVFLKSFVKLLGYVAHRVGIELDDLSVIGHNAVCLVLNVADLSENGGAKSAVDCGQYLVFIEIFHTLGEPGLCVECLVAVVLVGVENMTVNLKRIATKLREHERSCRV